MKGPPAAPAAATDAALQRLQRSRARLRTAWLSPPPQAIDPALARPWRLLRRWWRLRQPATAAAFGLTRWADTLLAGDLAGARDRWQRARAGVSTWVQRHPGWALGLTVGLTVALTAGLSVGLGALRVRQRAAWRGVAAGLGSTLWQHGQLWLLQQLSNPALYAALSAALRARGAAAPARPPVAPAEPGSPPAPPL